MPKIKYTDEHIDFIKANAANPTKVLMELFNQKFQLNATYGAIKSLKGKWKIKSGLKGGYTKYTEDQIQFVKDNVVNTEKDLVEMFNAKFNMNLTVEKLANMKHRLKITSGLVGGQFQKGQVPHNKGKKWDDYVSKAGQANSLKTVFKKGNVPANRVPIGSERITKDGFVEIKIQDGNLNKNWKLKHRFVWEQTNGKIPKGFKLAFLDGNRENITLDNLILIPNREELIMNQVGLFSKDPEITKTGALLARLIQRCKDKSGGTNEVRFRG